jgi:G protein-coupled receptor GPR1
MSQRRQISQSSRPRRVSRGKKPVSGVDMARGTNCPCLDLGTGTEPTTGGLVKDLQLLDNSSNRHGQIDREQLRLRRQLRLMFIYPLVYTLMWLLPFAHHCTMYFDRYVQRPIWVLRLGAAVCMSSMGFVDCLIFALREQPWQKVSPGNSSSRESLRIWKTITLRTQRVKSLVQGCTVGLGLALSKRFVTRKSTGVERAASIDDSVREAAKQARVRLELEREERRTALKATAVDLHSGVNGVGGEGL